MTTQLQKRALKSRPNGSEGAMWAPYASSTWRFVFANIILLASAGFGLGRFAEAKTCSNWFWTLQLSESSFELVAHDTSSIEDTGPFSTVAELWTREGTITPGETMERAGELNVLANGIRIKVRMVSK